MSVEVLITFLGVFVAILCSLGASVKVLASIARLNGRMEAHIETIKESLRDNRTDRERAIEVLHCRIDRNDNTISDHGERISAVEAKCAIIHPYKRD